MTRFIPPRPQKCSGFSLVELLVVLGMIAVLISLLLPSLATARQSARQVQCQSNVRQLAMALRNYAQDNDDLIPCWGWEYDELNTPWNAPTPATLQLGFKGGLVWKYVNSDGIYSCQNDPDTRAVHGPNPIWGRPPYWSYVINGNPGYDLAAVGRSPGGTQGWPCAPNWCVRLTHIPSNIILIFEQSEFDIAGFDNSVTLCDSTWAPGDDSLASIHNRGGNLAFFDGHAEWWPRSGYLRQMSTVKGTIDAFGGYVGYNPPY